MVDPGTVETQVSGRLDQPRMRQPDRAMRRKMRQLRRQRGQPARHGTQHRCRADQPVGTMRQDRIFIGLVRILHGRQPRYLHVGRSRLPAPPGFHETGRRRRTPPGLVGRLPVHPDAGALQHAGPLAAPVRAVEDHDVLRKGLQAEHETRQVCSVLIRRRRYQQPRTGTEMPREGMRTAGPRQPGPHTGRPATPAPLQCLGHDPNRGRTGEHDALSTAFECRQDVCVGQRLDLEGWPVTGNKASRVEQRPPFGRADIVLGQDEVRNGRRPIRCSARPRSFRHQDCPDSFGAAASCAFSSAATASPITRASFGSATLPTRVTRAMRPSSSASSASSCICPGAVKRA